MSIKNLIGFLMVVGLGPLITFFVAFSIGGLWFALVPTLIAVLLIGWIVVAVCLALDRY